MVDDDLIEFADEDEPAASMVGTNSRYWVRKILIVDDDEDVHFATELALRGQVFDGATLVFLHAYTSKQAFECLSNERDIAVILLDVVMESEEAGLLLVRQIRDVLDLQNVRIILRTGQPGYAPELETISKYDINDYKTKSELTREKLYTALITALRSYNQLVRLDHNRQGLARIIQSTNNLMLKEGLHEFAEGVITQLAGFIGVDPDGLVCFGAYTSDVSSESHLPVKVIASAGRYAQWMEHTAEFERSLIWQKVLKCFEQRENIVSEGVSCFYFEPESFARYVVYLDTPTSVGEDELRMVKMFTHNISLCAKNLSLLEQLKRIAYEDTLTGLLNRNGLIEYLNKGIPETGALLLIDLDQFSMLNDTFGIHYGDKLLCALAERYQRHPNVLMAARLWADQFALVVDSNACIQDLVVDLYKPVNIRDVWRLLTFCAGVSFPDTGSTANELVANATIALKRAKQKGVNQLVYFNTRMVDELRDRSMMLSELKDSLDHQNFTLMYQPQIDLNTLQIVGVEALCRWRNKRNEPISPEVFIPLAEQSGLILALGEWVLHKALEDLHRIRSIKPSVRMAVNVSTLQFNDPDFERVISNALALAGVSGNCLDIEITESVGVLGSVEVEEKLSRLKKLGVMISIDDFGTGFSSLSYLDKLSADQLKIDKSFVSCMNPSNTGSNIADMIVSLGRKFHLTVIAEGIETEAQLNALKAQGCHQGQGYWFSKPLTIDDLLTWLEKT
ncbi:EAL domain-containing protein [Nitrincola nitratireducens]|uniref:Bacteriophytochrome cph2 n=1 Tax=Nitrincola nitratireducens TaxID=1229521 RepID=W9URN7_9GAMM|nr:EAL domain-containing protein [Nitrincola nitratireducens]EXJ09878.1 Bacteriophytochrome cph2 [Nitrincola nitratireducens]